MTQQNMRISLSEHFFSSLTFFMFSSKGHQELTTTTKKGSKVILPFSIRKRQLSTLIHLVDNSSTRGWPNRPLLSCPKPLFQSETKCEAVNSVFFWKSEIAKFIDWSWTYLGEEINKHANSTNVVCWFQQSLTPLRYNLWSDFSGYLHWLTLSWFMSMFYCWRWSSLSIFISHQFSVLVEY